MFFRPRTIILILLVIAFGGGAVAQQAPSTVNLSFDFRNGTLGWQGDFSDYPPAYNPNNFYELQAGLRALPSEISPGGTGFFFQGSNHSADLFMFMKRRLGPVDGIVAGTRYQITFTLTLASIAQSNCVGIGGAPGESVYLKAGASQIEPVPVPYPNGWLVMNVDKGNQAVSGTAASVAGNIANGRPCNLSSQPYVTIQRIHQHTMEVAANSAGELWLLVGTDSGFEGRTTLYYQRIDVKLTPVGTGAAPTLLPMVNGFEAVALDSVTFARNPFPAINTHNFSADNRTRVMLFARDLELLPGETASAVTAEAEDFQGRTYPVTVEYAGRVPNFDWLTQINVKLPDELYQKTGCLIRVKWHGLYSNKVMLTLKSSNSQ